MDVITTFIICIAGGFLLQAVLMRAGGLRHGARTEAVRLMKESMEEMGQDLHAPGDVKRRGERLPVKEHDKSKA